MRRPAIEYHIAQTGECWGIYREGTQIAVRSDPADAIAFANYFADRETLLGFRRVRVSADTVMHRTLRDMRAINHLRAVA
ncbi:hypothetical protein [Xanthomonas sp. NCPPB 2632]|jgi:hypothetical protein|uniref:hypothetical protein n=1 Tax=Xanthomonas sp. NCPPB 2632 TaxID=3240912 RepID=UPI003513DDFD